MEAYLDKIFEKTDILWRKKSDSLYVCVATQSENDVKYLQLCMDVLIISTDPKFKKLILVKNIQSSNAGYIKKFNQILTDFKVSGADELSKSEILKDVFDMSSYLKNKLYIYV